MSVSTGTLIDAVLGQLQSWSLDEEQQTTLAADMAVDDLSFTVTTARGIAAGISPGIIEIGHELMYCDTVSDTAATVTASGRGYKSTVAAAHAAGSRIISQPTFPRAKTLDEINQALGRVFPMLYGIGSYETVASGSTVTYDLPDDAQWVVAAKWQEAGGLKYWTSVNRWRVSPGGGTQFGDGLNGITVDVADRIPVGRPLQFLYAKRPTLLVNESDDFTTVTGLPQSVRDVIILGAATSMVSSQELSRLQVSSVEQQNRSGLVGPSAALTSSRFLEQRYQARLEEERRSLQRLYPPRVTGSWK